MKNIIPAVVFFALAVFTPLPSYAQEGHQHDASGKQVTTTVEAPEDCLYCGMNRTAFAHSRAMVEYQNGDKIGVCSINCAIIDLDKNPKKKLKRLLVADYNSKKLISARSAHWVMGGCRPGVMTINAKWAFTGKKQAQTFVTEFGGKLVTYNEVMAAVKNELTAH